MAVAVNFWAFSKRENSTAIPSGTPANTFSCNIKAESTILSPVLEIGLGMSFNPSDLNYAQIAPFSRYYFVTDWQWSQGLWICTLQVDPLASYRTEIGNTTKLIIRSSHSSTHSIIDSLYPAMLEEEEIAQEHNFGFDIASGDYVLGIVNRQPTHVGGMVSFYRLTQSEMDDLRRAMYPTASDYFEDITQITGDVLRSVIDPWQYIISCKRFPISVPSDNIQSVLYFGQWQSDPSGQDRMVGWRLSSMSSWGSLTHDFSLDTQQQQWLARDARQRSEPGARMFIVCNPWGAIQLSPADFSDSQTVRLEILPDFITGDALLKIYSVKGPLQTLIAQRTAKIGIDTTVATTRVNAMGAATSAIGAVGAAFAGTSFIGALSGVANAASQLTPSLVGATAMQEGMRSLEGIARLIVRLPKFPDEDNADLGRPLYRNSMISALPGYLKCADGEIAAAAYKEELSSIAEFLTGGFFYE